jgi:hypothetical protein
MAAGGCVGLMLKLLLSLLQPYHTPVWSSPPSQPHTQPLNPPTLEASRTRHLPTMLVVRPPGRQDGTAQQQSMHGLLSCRAPSLLVLELICLAAPGHASHRSHPPHGTRPCQSSFPSPSRALGHASPRPLPPHGSGPAPCGVRAAPARPARSDANGWGQWGGASGVGGMLGPGAGRSGPKGAAHAVVPNHHAGVSPRRHASPYITPVCSMLLQSQARHSREGILYIVCGIRAGLAGAAAGGSPAHRQPAWPQPDKAPPRAQLTAVMATSLKQHLQRYCAVTGVMAADQAYHTFADESYATSRRWSRPRGSPCAAGTRARPRPNRQLPHRPGGSRDEVYNILI